MVNDIAVQDFVNAIKEQPTDNNTTYNATVSRIDSEGVVWVNLYGSDKETPTASTSAEVHSGDAVTVNWRNNKLYIGGNYTNPSAGVGSVNRVAGIANNAQAVAEVAYTAANSAVNDAERAHAAADEAEGHAQTALTNAGIAQTAAESAQTSADSALVSLSTVEDVVGVLNWITAHGTMTANGSTALDPAKVYFIRDNNGDYTVGSYNYSIVAEPKAEDRTSYYTLSVDESVQNYVATHVTVNSEGMWLIPDQNGSPTTNGKKILIATGAGTYTAGTYIIDRSSGTNKTIASFRADGATIGETDKTHVDMDYRSFQMVDKNGNTYAYISDLRDANGDYTQVETFEGNGSKTRFYLTMIAKNKTYTVTVDGITQTSGISKDYEWFTFTTAPASGANIVATYVTASVFAKAYTFGHRNGDVGVMSFAEGVNVTASGMYSHAEGNETVASNDFAHAEGNYSIASGKYAHAEGGASEAIGYGSHSQNVGTIARGYAQTAIGQYNIEDTNNKYALIVGNGSYSTHANAFTIDWDGNIEIALDTAAASGTDHDIYAALVALGWDSDVIV